MSIRSERVKLGVETKRAKNRLQQPYDTVYRAGMWRVLRKADGVLLPGEYHLEGSARAALNHRVSLDRKKFSRVDIKD